MVKKLTIFCGLIVILIFTSMLVTASGKVVGMFLDGYQEDCKIIRGSEDKEITDIKEKENLYQGDLIVKETGIEDIIIKYHPYAEGQVIDENTIKIVFNPCEEKETLWDKVLAILGFEESRHQLYYAVTRGNLDLMYYPILKRRGFLYQDFPFDQAVVFNDSKLRFRAPDLAGNLLIITDSQGNEILKEQVAAEASFYELDLSSINLQVGKKYYWKIGRYGTEKVFTVLDSQLQAELKKSLGMITAQEGDVLRKELKQVIFLQSVNAAIMEEGNLYWLCYQILEDVVNQAKEDEQFKLSNEEEESVELILQEIDTELFM